MSNTVPGTPSLQGARPASMQASMPAHAPDIRHASGQGRGASARDALNDALQQRQDAGKPVRFWLRDDDAVEPGEALDHLLSLTQAHAVPVTLAVIPAFSGEALAQRLTPLSHVDVAVHGWSHVNHAPATEKKQELGAHRPLEEVCAELERGLQHLQQWHGPQCVPLLVPPWNRISASLIPLLPSIGFQAVSTFAEISFESIRMINTHVDIIDWKAGRERSRGRGRELGRNDIRASRPADELFAEITARVLAGCELTGVLTHHLVHEPQAWHFLEQLFELTADYPAVEWTAVSDLLSA